MAVFSFESFPLGFRFRPTDEELINHYLRLKINGKDSQVQVIPEIDICKWEPWDLPGLSLIKTDDQEWFFFCPRDWKYTKGHRSNRATGAGYWKATGKDRTIKSRTSGMNLIGTKKTLVFYRGRAPKGERTNWIIHEYRAIEKELDGTEAGQGAFVLCRLFRKPEENTEISNCDEVEPSGLSPTTSNSSPGSTPSKLALVHATPVSDMQIGKQPAGIDIWLDNMTSDTLVPVEILCNSFMASDVEDQTEEVTPTEVDQQLEEDLKLFYVPAFEPLDYNVFSPLTSQMDMELGPSYVDSLFANDFGNPNGVQFQDGKGEEDVSITEFFDAVFNNQDEYYCEESTSQQNSVVESETIESDRMFMARPWRKDSESSSDRDTEVVQAHYDPEVGVSRYNEHVDIKDSFQMTTAQGSYRNRPFYDGEYRRGNMSLLQNDPVRLDASSVMDPVDELFIEESTSQKNPGNDSGLVGTGIKIRTHQPQNHSSSHKFVTQGVAPRKILLQGNFPCISVYCSEATQLSCSADDHETKPVIEAGEVTEHTTVHDEPQKSSLLESDKKGEINQEPNTKLRLRSRRDGTMDSDQKGPSVFLETPQARRCFSFSPVFIVSGVLIIILLMIFIGFTKMP